MKNTKKNAMRRTFRAAVQLDANTAGKILFLSRCLIQLWNLAQAECEKRLANVNYLKEVIANIQAKGSIVEFVKLPDGREISGDVMCIAVAEEMIRQSGITAISLNFWLTPMREQAIKLDDGSGVQLNAISSDVEREVLRKLAGSYQSFFKLKKNKDFRARKPGLKKEEWFQTMSWSSFKIKDGVLSVPGYAGERIAIPLKTVVAGQTSPGSYLTEQIAGKKVVFVTLSREQTGQFILSLTTTEPLPKLIEHPKIFWAIDLGAGDIAVAGSDGVEYLIPARRPDKFWMKRIAPVEARQEKRTKNSRGWRRLAEARRYMHNRSGAQKDSYQKKLADALVARGIDCVIVGKSRNRLGLSRTDSATPAQHWGVQNTGYMFRQLLYIRNKCKERGVHFIELPDPRRQGELAEPHSKFRAARVLLEQGLAKFNWPVECPKHFQRGNFSFRQ